MNVTDIVLDSIAIASFIISACLTLFRIERKDETDLNEPEEVKELRQLQRRRHEKFKESIAFTLLMITVACMGTRTTGIANVHVEDHFNTVYSNSINAEVSYYNDGTILTGGQALNSTNSASDVAYRAGISKIDRKLVLKKNQTTVTRDIDDVEIKGDKTGKVVRIDYGKRSKYTYVLGIKFNQGTESVVKIYLKESKSVSKDRADLEKLLDVKK